MADLLDQYRSMESKTQKTYQESSAEPISSGYVTVATEEDKPMFQREKFSIRLQETIIDVAVANNTMVVALKGCQVKRFDVANPFEVDTVNVTKRTDDQISQIFLDPTARHLFISMESTDFFHLGRNNKKTRLLNKFKGHSFKCIAWNKACMNEFTTGPILLGTNKGLLCETEIDSEEKFLSMGTEKTFKIIYDVGKNSCNEEEGLTGIHLEKLPNFEQRYVILLTTPSRLYQFVGDIGEEVPVFQPVVNIFYPDHAQFHELPGNLTYSNLAFYFPRPKSLPSNFAWLTGPGVYFGQLDFKRNTPKANITMETRLLPPTECQQDTPVAIAITDFHCALLFENKFETICILNDEEDFSELIPPRYGTMLGLRSDHMRKTLWAFSETSIFRYHIHHESRDVWKMYLNRQDFELAKDYCKNNPAQMDLVLRQQAEYLFDQKMYLQAATYYALTHISFEEVTLKFLQVKNAEALKTFLQKKMVNIKPSEKTQLTMLVTWLIELYLNQMGILRDKGVKDKEYETIQDDFRKFINQSRIKNCLEQNKHVAYDLLSSHGDTENMVFFSMLMKDYHRVIQHHIQQENYLAALDVLKKQTEDNAEYQAYLFEQFSPTLMQHIPKQLVEVWKQRDLDPKKLIPALVALTQRDDSKSIQHAVDYLQHCVFKLYNEDQAIHNYLISLYCKMDDEAPLLRYLNGQGEDADDVFYELKYALRQCSEHNKQEAAVQIYSTMGLYEEAVDLALKVDVEKAKLYADKPEYDDVFKKKLWLKVARHVVEQKQDIGRAMELLKECPLLKIEDILPFFPDFVTIDHFKEAICESLEEYNRHICQLKHAMEDATESAKNVRAEIHDIRNRCGVIQAQENCAICHFPLVTRSFYYFPCTHVFHADCLIDEVKKHTKEKQRLKIESLASKLQSLAHANNPSNATAVEQTTEELEDLIASDCLYCGNVMIKSLDEPFIPLEEFDAVLESWS